MFACRSRSALARTRAVKRVPTYLVLSRTKFSTVAPLRQPPYAEDANSKGPGARLPLSLQAVWYEPFRRAPTHGLPVCDLQLRSFSVRNLEFMCDFALRAAYYCHLPAAGPVPLPKKTERWTVPKGHFVHKKSQENYERVTHKRLIQIKDGHPETVELWLAFLRKHQYYGVGMKANMFGFDELGVGKRMNVSLETVQDVTRPKWSHFGSRKTFETAEKARKLLESKEYKSLSHEEVLKEITEVEHFQTLAKGILEDPKYKAFIEKERDLVEEKVEEKIQANAMEEALEKVNEVEPPEPEAAAEKAQNVNEAQIPKAEAIEEEPIIEEVQTPKAAAALADEALIEETKEIEEVQAAPVEEPTEITSTQTKPTVPGSTPEIEASSVGETPTLIPTPKIVEAHIPLESTSEVKNEATIPELAEVDALTATSTTTTAPESTPEFINVESSIVAPVDVPVATPSEAASPETPEVDTSAAEKIVEEKLKARAAEEVNGEKALPDVTEVKEEAEDRAKVGEKPREN